jgi:hypothetical protein
LLLLLCCFGSAFVLFLLLILGKKIMTHTSVK